MGIKLIATDVDGTLVAEDHLTISEKNIKAFELAKKKGIITSLVTGRTFSLIKRENNLLHGVDYAIISNGAAIFDIKKNKMIYSCHIPLEKMEQILKIFKNYPLVYEIYMDGKGYINSYTYEHFYESLLPDVFLREFRKLMEVTDELGEVIHNGNVEKVCINHIPKKYIDSLRKELEKIPELFYASGFDGNMEITAMGADKGNALKWLSEKLEIFPEEIMAFGDSDNDKTMLKFAGQSYAMISGKEEAKSAAKYITTLSNSEGGVGKTIMEYL